MQKETIIHFLPNSTSYKCGFVTTLITSHDFGHWRYRQQVPVHFISVNTLAVDFHYTYIQYHLWLFYLYRCYLSWLPGCSLKIKHSCSPQIGLPVPWPRRIWTTHLNQCLILNSDREWIELVLKIQTFYTKQCANDGVND